MNERAEIEARASLEEPSRDRIDEAWAKQSQSAVLARREDTPPDQVTGIEGAGELDMSVPGEDEWLMSERCVCAAFMIYPESMMSAWKAAVANLGKSPGNKLFFAEKHRSFVRKALDLTNKGVPVDPITLVQNTTTAERDAMGGMRYVAGHAWWCFSLNNAIYHLGKLVERYRRLELAELAQEVETRASGGEDINQTIIEMTARAKGLIRTDSTLDGLSPVKIADILDSIIMSGEESNRTIPSAFRTRGSQIGDYKRGEIVAIGAPPGNGKTADAMQEAQFAATNGFTVDAFTFESDETQWVQRFIARNYKIDGRKFNRREKYWTQAELDAIDSGGEAMARLYGHLHIAPRVAASVHDVASMIEARKSRTGQPCDLIIIDHIGKLRSPLKGVASTDYSAMCETVSGLWELAAKENAAILIYTQLTVDAIRNSFKDGSKFPSIGAFRGGALVESAKVCMILHKDEQEMLSGGSVVEQGVVICKANDGQPGVIRSLFLKPYAMHIEDVNAQDRLDYRSHLESLGFDIHSERRDKNKR